MTLWKLRFALEYCKKSRGISKDNAKTMIFNAYRESKLHILIRKHWKRFVIKNNANKKIDLRPNWWNNYEFDKFEKHLEAASKIVKSWPLEIQLTKMNFGMIFAK